MLSDGGEEEGREYTCLRHNKKMVMKKPRCLDPKAYCKYRTSCPIHLLEKEAARADR
jgi:hypothetical protein